MEFDPNGNLPFAVKTLAVAYPEDFQDKLIIRLNMALEEKLKAFLKSRPGLTDDPSIEFGAVFFPP